LLSAAVPGTSSAVRHLPPDTTAGAPRADNAAPGTSPDDQAEAAQPAMATMPNPRAESPTGRKRRRDVLMNDPLQGLGRPHRIGTGDAPEIEFCPATGRGRNRLLAPGAGPCVVTFGEATHRLRQPTDTSSRKSRN
jgi:hypothetical protein